MSMMEYKKRYKVYKVRVAGMPAGWPAAVKAFERYLEVFGPSQGKHLLPMLEDLADLFEQSAADGTRIRDVVGEDPVQFAEDFLANYPEGNWVAKERRRITDAIAAAEAQEAAGGSGS